MLRRGDRTLAPHHDERSPLSEAFAKNPREHQRDPHLVLA